jgi:hypothetical protein
MWQAAESSVICPTNFLVNVRSRRTLKPNVTGCRESSVICPTNFLVNVFRWIVSRLNLKCQLLNSVTVRMGQMWGRYRDWLSLRKRYGREYLQRFCCCAQARPSLDEPCPNLHCIQWTGVSSSHCWSLGICEHLVHIVSCLNCGLIISRDSSPPSAPTETEICFCDFASLQ